MLDPFLIEGPASISFSGGRTSGYMLWRILQAHGGKLPAGVNVLFANTGKEMGQTLDFVRDCSKSWDVPVVWLEYRWRDGHHVFEVVDWSTASRAGEPFAQVIEHRRMLPNPMTRFCTVELKVRTMHRYLRSLGWTEWDSYVGIRADEARRLAKLKNQDYGKHEERFAPLAVAGVTKRDVGAFWAAQPFDLGLPNMNGTTMHGNCDLCFLKGANQVLSLIREDPKRAIWWMAQETHSAEHFVERKNGDVFRFRSDRSSYAQMQRMALDHGELFDDEPIQDCMCVD